MPKLDVRFLLWVDSYLEEHSYAPSLREAMQFCGFRSTSTMWSHLNRLRDEGLVGYLDRQPRTLHTKRGWQELESNRERK